MPLDSPFQFLLCAAISLWCPYVPLLIYIPPSILHTSPNIHLLGPYAPKEIYQVTQVTTWPIDPLTSLITSSFISFLQNRCPYLSQKKQNKTVVDEVNWLPGKVLSGNPFVWERKQLHLSGNDVCHKHRETVKGIPISEVSHSHRIFTFVLLLSPIPGLYISNWFHD